MMGTPPSSRLSPDGKGVVIVDQTLLPGELSCVTLTEPEAMREAIVSLRVRGAPAIGLFAANCLAALAGRSGLAGGELVGFIEKQAAFLTSARPTAYNLFLQAERMVKKARACAGLSVPDAAEALRREAERLWDEDVAICKAIAENGLSLLKDGASVLTYCNAGPLATSRYGTALGPLLLGRERGMTFSAFCCETRPLLQGARLTAWELKNAGVDVTVVCDNMAASLMAAGRIGACLVGCDRVAENGDAANKIGTLGVAVLAKHFGVPFYVFCPSTTIDPSCRTGADIVIEQRGGDEIGTLYYRKRMTPEGVGYYNPAFDVTPAELITAIVTERGVFRPGKGDFCHDTLL